MSNRFGEAHKKMPYCLRQLPENRPRNRQEFMIRKRMIPEDPDMYFDDARRFLYDSSCMAEELERLKRFRTQSLGLVRKQTEYLKSMILKKKTTQEADIAQMKERFKKAQADHAKALGDVKGRGKKKAAKTASSTSVSSSPSSSRQ